MTSLIIKDRLSRAIQAWVVEQKGAGIDAGEAVKSAVNGIRSFGHQGRLLIKTDNEPAILALKALVVRELGVDAITVESPPQE